MTTHRGIEYRLAPGSAARADRLLRQAGVCRFVWNQVLGSTLEARAAAEVTGEDPPSVSAWSLKKKYPELREKFPFLKDHHAQITRDILGCQAEAWKACFRGDAKPPKFKSRHSSTPFFIMNQNFRIADGKIRIPKIGWMRISRKGGNPHPDGRPGESRGQEDGRKVVRLSHLRDLQSGEIRLG